MKRFCAFLFVFASIATTSSTMPAARAAAPQKPLRVVDGRVGDWRGGTSGYGGTSSYSHGEFIYQDHIYDDLGPDTRQRSEQHGNTGAPAGDYRYPTDEKRYGYNAADLLELRFATDRDGLWILARMNTLKKRDTTVVAIGVDTDRKSTTGGGPWPYGAGLAAAGVDRVITLWGSRGTITSLPKGKPVALSAIAVNTSNENNAIEARIPISAIGGGGGGGMRVWAASGLWDVATSRWMSASPGNPSATSPGGGSAAISTRAFNVAFRSDETGSFMEEKQAAALASGDITSFHANLDLGVLRADASRPYRLKAGTFYVRVMDQKLTIPPYHEGLSYEGIPGRFQGVSGSALSQHFDYYGRHQPYGLYIPSTYGKKTRIPAALVLHGHGGSHSTYNSQPGFLADMGEGDGSANQPPMFLITPLARGSSFYADWGEADTLAVSKDVFSRFSVDPNRLYLTGYSMGGYGVYRLASLYPDRFAAAVVWAGYTGEFTGSYLTDPRWIIDDPTGLQGQISGQVRAALAPTGIGSGRTGKAVIGDPVETLENLRSLPLVHLAGTNDQIVPTSGQYAAPRRLAELGYRSRFDLYPAYEHLTFAIVDDWTRARAWLGTRTRETSPRTISYKFSDGWTQKGLAKKLGLVHGNAWWLRDVSMRKTTEDALTFASVEASSQGIPGRSVSVEELTNVAESPTPHLQQLVSWKKGKALPAGNRLDLTIARAGGIRIDLARAGLKACGLVVAIRSDGPATLRLSGRFPEGSTTYGLREVSSRVESDGLVLTLRRGLVGALAVRCPA